MPESGHTPQTSNGVPESGMTSATDRKHRKTDGEGPPGRRRGVEIQGKRGPGASDTSQRRTRSQSKAHSESTTRDRLLCLLQDWRTAWKDEVRREQFQRKIIDDLRNIENEVKEKKQVAHHLRKLHQEVLELVVLSMEEANEDSKVGGSGDEKDRQITTTMVSKLHCTCVTMEKLCTLGHKILNSLRHLHHENAINQGLLNELAGPG